MATEKFLFAWLGTSDVTALGRSGANDELGPIAAALNRFSFDRVWILVSDDRNETSEGVEGIFDQRIKYKNWLKKRFTKQVELLETNVADSTDMRAIHEWASKIVEDAESRSPAAKKTFHLSPGTPYMAHVWVLLRRRWNAELIKSDRHGNVSIAEIPDDIFDYYLGYITAKQQSPHKPDRVIANSPAMQKLLEMVELAAPKDTPILFEGETGVGKSLLAELVHNGSPRKNKKIVAANCGAIPDELFESVMFGHRKGSFTGAHADREGLIQQANNGTLFLDEVGELSPANQVKLLRALQEKKVRRIGDKQETEVDFRLVCATNRQLLEDIKRGSFRKDLYYRIAVFPLHIPPLRERKEDLKIFIEQKLDELARKGFGQKKISEDAREKLLCYEWPGNVRELENFLERLAVYTQDKVLLDIDDIDIAMPMPLDSGKTDMARELGPGFVLDDFLKESQKEYLELAWNKTHNLTKAAKLLGLKSKNTFRSRCMSILGYIPQVDTN